MGPPRLNPALQALKRHVQAKERQSPAAVVVPRRSGDHDADLDSGVSEAETFNALEEMRREAEQEQVEFAERQERARQRQKQKQKQGQAPPIVAAAAVARTTSSHFRPRLARIADDGEDDEDEDAESPLDDVAPRNVGAVATLPSTPPSLGEPSAPQNVYGFEGEQMTSSEESESSDGDDDDADDDSDSSSDDDSRATLATTGPNAPSLKDAPTPFSTISNDPFASIILPPPLLSRSSKHTGEVNTTTTTTGDISYPPATVRALEDDAQQNSLPSCDDTPPGSQLAAVMTTTTSSTTPLVAPPDSPSDDHKTQAIGTSTVVLPATSSSGLSSLSLSLSRRRQETPTTQADIDGDRLRALGYDQVLGRDYDLWSAFSLCYLNIGVLQGALFGVLATWTFGGPRVILTVWPIGGLVLTLITITLAELTSSYPICGAFPAWVWRICRNGIGHERELSWIVAGLVLLYHIGVSTLLPWQLAGFISETIQLALPDVSVERWWILLFALGIIALLTTLGSFRIGRHPWLWKSAFVYSIAVWIVMVVSLLASSRPSSSASLHQTFSNQTGYTSKALVYMLCLVATSVATGVDAASHFAEEVRNPARNLPIAMIGSTLLSYTLGYIGFWVFLMVVDADALEAISISRFPSGAILTQTLGSRGGITLLALILVAVGFQALVQIQASARYVFSISRDQALPMASMWARTSRSQLPVNALWLTSGVVAVLQVAVWASPDVLQAVVSSSAATGCLLVYMLPVALYMLSDLDLQYESRTAFSLRRASKPIGLAASVLVTFLLVLVQIPSSIPVTAGNFPWSIIVTLGVLLLCGASWALYGRRRYSGPIQAITAWTAGQPISLQEAVKRENNS